LKTKAVLGKALPLAVIGAVLSGAGLGVSAFVAGKTGLGKLLLVVPLDIHAPELDVKKIERFSDDNFPLTYEIMGPEKAVVLGVEYPVTLVGTNTHYPRLLGYPIEEGSFFSKQDWENCRRHAVLNGKGAFTLFGSSHVAGRGLKIRGETWIVTGVINDGDEDTSRIYAPSSVWGGRASSLIAGTGGAGGGGGEVDAAYIRDNLKSLGIYDRSFTFFDLGAGTNFLGEQAAAAFMLLCSLFLAFCMFPALGKFRAVFSLLRQRLNYRYSPELPRSGGRTACTFFASLLLPPACSGGILFLLRRVVSICLPWQDLPSLGDIDRRIFYPKLALFEDCAAASGILFLLFLVFLAAALILFIKAAYFEIKIYHEVEKVEKRRENEA
jgi:hypothetical protein